MKQHHHVRRYRMQAALTQREIAQLLGCQSSATVCQYEALKREPDLRTAFAYQVVFGLPMEKLFPGIYQKVEREVRQRAEHLSRQLSETKASPALSYKSKALKSIAQRSTIQGAITQGPTLSVNRTQGASDQSQSNI